MIDGARYVHTNLIVRDWRTLASFYQSLFGCVLVPPERDYSGPALEAGTGVPGAALRGVHLRLPDHGLDVPTIEIFSYSQSADGPAPAVNRPGFAHIAFAVPSVPDARRKVLATGGKPVSEIVTLKTSAGSRVTWRYVETLKAISLSCSHGRRACRKMGSATVLKIKPADWPSPATASCSSAWR